jgi:hypothetical protein
MKNVRNLKGLTVAPVTPVTILVPSVQTRKNAKRVRPSTAIRSLKVRPM